MKITLGNIILRVQAVKVAFALIFHEIGFVYFRNLLTHECWRRIEIKGQWKNNAKSVKVFLFVDSTSLQALWKRAFQTMANRVNFPVLLTSESISGTHLIWANMFVSGTILLALVVSQAAAQLGTKVPCPSSTKCIEAPSSSTLVCPKFRCTNTVEPVCAKGPDGCYNFINKCQYNSVACGNPGKC